jgi:CheY-like chemotaxis protein
MLEVESANQAKSRFLAAASHDLRQPLSALGIYIKVLADKVAPAEQRYVSSMKDCVAGLSNLLNDLLDLSKLSAGVVKVNVDDFPIADLLDSLQSMHGPVAESRGLRLRCVPARLTVRTDPVLLQRILGNFIDNALRYTNRGGVVVGCRRRQGKVFVEVWDSGIGIPADKRTEIFEEFRQLGDEARNSGSGLGLAIAAKTAALLGLEIQLRSRLGRGSVFAIEIALGQAKTLPAQPIRSAAYRSLRIALVEDNRLVREALTTAMQEAGHQVVSTPSGDKMLAALGTQPPDIVVSDYRLSGGLTGYEAISALRARFAATLPAVIISGDTDPVLLRRMNERGIVVLHKPLDIEELQAYLEDLTYPATATNS